MRYIFITLITANVLIFAYLLLIEQRDDDNSATTSSVIIEAEAEAEPEATVNDDKKNRVVIEQLNNSGVADQSATIKAGDQAIKLDSTLTPNENISNQVLINAKSDRPGLISDSLTTDKNVANPSIPIYKCLKIIAGDKKTIESFLQKYKYKNNIKSLIVSKPAFKTLYIAAMSKSEAEIIKNDLIERNIISDAYVTKISGKYAVSLGVFSKEPGMERFKNNLLANGVKDLNTKQGYRDYKTYYTYLHITENERNLIEKSSSNNEIEIKIINDEKKCIL